MCKTKFDYATGELNIVQEKAFSNGDQRRRARATAADDVQRRRGHHVE